MKVNYSDEPVVKAEKSIFLAGPIPRDIEVQTWRKEAIKLSQDLGFDGIVYVPERKFDDRTFNYDNQVWWKEKRRIMLAL